MKVSKLNHSIETYQTELNKMNGETEQQKLQLNESISKNIKLSEDLSQLKGLFSKSEELLSTTYSDIDLLTNNIKQIIDNQSFNVVGDNNEVNSKLSSLFALQTPLLDIMSSQKQCKDDICHLKESQVESEKLIDERNKENQLIVNELEELKKIKESLEEEMVQKSNALTTCLLYTSPSPRDRG